MKLCHYIALTLFAFINSYCMSNSNNINQLLREKYNSAFTIEKEVYDKEQNCTLFESFYEFEGNRISFSGKYVEAQLLEDNLIQELFGYQLNHTIKKQLTSKSENYLGSKCFLNYNYAASEKFNIAALTLDEFLKTHRSTVVNVWIYLKGVISENPINEERLSNMILEFKKNRNHRINISVDFWDEKMLKNQDVNALKFCFWVYDESCADNPLKMNTYVKESLKVVVEPNSPLSVALKNLIINYSDKRFTEYVKI